MESPLLYNQPMKIIGVTGAIASGKSTLARIFNKKGAVLLDADVIAQSVIAEGLPAYNEILTCFGDAVVGAKKEIDRKQLARIVFNDAEKLKALNKIVHPKVEKEILQKLNGLKSENASSKRVVLDVPLLFEAGLDKYCDLAIVVRAKREIRLKRLMLKGMTLEDAKNRITAQEEKHRYENRADIIVDNENGTQALEQQADMIWKELDEVR
jgi:dephospho-CoA kinase